MSLDSSDLGFTNISWVVEPMDKICTLLLRNDFVHHGGSDGGKFLDTLIQAILKLVRF